MSASSARTEIATLAITYVRVRSERGDWAGETIHRTRRRLWSFVTWLPKTLTSITSVKARHVQAWLDAPLGHSASYRRLRLSTVRGFFTWCLRRGHVAADPTLDVVSPTVPPSPPRSFDDDETERIVDVARRDPRDLVCTSLGLHEGLRCVEMSRALITDINWRARTMEVRGKFHRGAVSRVVALSRHTVAAIEDYLASEPSRGVGPLIRSRLSPSEPITPGHIGRLIDAVLVDAGVKRAAWDGRTAHALRHTSATEAVEAGVPDRITKRQHGWSSDVMLEHYAKGAAVDLHLIHDLRAQRRERVIGTAQLDLAKETR